MSEHDDDLNPARAVILVAVVSIIPWLVIGFYLWVR